MQLTRVDVKTFNERNLTALTFRKHNTIFDNQHAAAVVRLTVPDYVT